MKAGILVFVSCCSLSLLAGCASTNDVLAETTGASLPRALSCLARNTDGACVKKLCTSTSGGVSGDCASYGEACVAAKLNWIGGSQDGICSKP